MSKGGWKLSGLDCAAEGSVTFSLTTCGKSHYLLTFGSCFLLVEISEGWKYTQVCLCGKLLGEGGPPALLEFVLQSDWLNKPNPGKPSMETVFLMVPCLKHLVKSLAFPK